MNGTPDRPAPQEATVNYLDALAEDIGRIVPDCPHELLRLYALLALVTGTDVSLEDVHNAWAAWRAATKPDHPALIPFADLPPEVQALDAPYRDAIRQAAPRFKLVAPAAVAGPDAAGGGR